MTQPAGAAVPEVPQPRPVRDEQIGDEKPAQYEEHVDAEEPAVQQILVIRHDGQNS
jgi:hypothetical protein